LKEHSRLLRRGSARIALWIGLLAAGFGGSLPVAAEIIPDEARLVRINFVGRGQAWIGDELYKLSPGVRIRGKGNRLVLPGSVKGRYAARVLVDRKGDIFRVWLGDPSPDRVGPITP